jgi:hypothetical protein
VVGLRRLGLYVIGIKYEVLLFRQSYPYTGLYRPLRLQLFEVPRISRQSAYEDYKVVSPTHRPPLPPGDISGTDLR